MRTLLEFTVPAQLPMRSTPPVPAGEMFVCGGGAMNCFFMERLATCCRPGRCTAPPRCGMAPDQVEALAFASFARSTVQGLPANVPSVTGASRACILGAVYAV